MNTKLDVTVSVDPDSWTVALKPLGDLTARNAVALLPLARKAAEVFPGFSVAIDLSQTRTASPAALTVLAAAGLKDEQLNRQPWFIAGVVAGHRPGQSRMIGHDDQGPSPGPH